MQLKTIRGYDFYECSSAFQKAIRRGDTKKACYFGMEMFKSNYIEYLWKRLYIISAEDCAGIITVEVAALNEGFRRANIPKSKEKVKGAVFITKAIIILCEALKSRDADHACGLLYKEKRGITDQEIQTALMCAETSTYVPIPDYAYDCHTMKGKRRGKTREDFFTEELNALSPRQPGLFDDLIKK